VASVKIKLKVPATQHHRRMRPAPAHWRAISNVRYLFGLALYTWEILGIYRATNGYVLAIEGLRARTLLTRSLTERSIIGGDLNILQTDWKGNAEKASGLEAV